MISKLYLESFKCFPSLKLLLAPVTLLTGLNSSGKSSILQALRICKTKKIPEGLGTEHDLKCSNTSGYPKISVEFDGGYTEQCNFTESGQLKSEPSVFFDMINYISADRFGPRAALPFKSSSHQVGEFGENVYSALHLYREASGVPKLLRHQSLPETSGVFEQVRAWLSIISPGVLLDFQAYGNADICTGEFAGFRPTNVGFGLSYTLPIITSVIINASIVANNKVDESAKSATLLIENPEAHLHPRGQTQLGYFLALASRCGVQTIIETHSEHIINGIRLAVKDTKVPDADVIFHYFQKNKDEDTSTVTSIFTDKYGMLDNWPEGFFDETEKTLLRLI